MASPASAAEVTTFTITPKTRPTVLTGSNRQAGDLEILTTAAVPANSTMVVTLHTPGGSNCQNGESFVGFSVDPQDDGGATVTATASALGVCNGAGIKNTLTIANSAEIPNNTKITLTDVRYTIGSQTPLGNVGVGISLVAPVADDSNATIASVDRIDGANRFVTAANIAKDAYPVSGGCVGARRVIVTSGTNYPDALAASALAGKGDVPILLVNPTGAIPAGTIDAIDKLGVQNVMIIGGNIAVAAAVENELTAREITNCGGGDAANATKIDVDRIGGSNRYDTAKLVAAEVGLGTFDNGLTGACDAVSTAILVSGENFADALAAGPLAARGANPAGGAGAPGCGLGQIPIYLTAPGTLSPETIAGMNALDPAQVIIIGGTTAVSQAVENAVDAQIPSVANIERVAGATRQDTAKELAEVILDVDLGGFNGSRAFIARGDAFPDALAGGPLAAKRLAPILLTASTSSLGVPATGLLTNDENILKGTLFGGTTALTAAVATQVGTAFTSRSAAI